MNPFLARVTAIGLLCAAALAPSFAVAETPDPTRAATAQVLFEQATTDMDNKDYVAACKKLEEVVKLVPDALAAKMTLGECYEARGKSASAWSQYIIVEGLAPKQQNVERAEEAAKRASALKPKLAMLTVEVPEELAKMPGLSVIRDGAPMGEGQWGTPLPIDAGTHEITASAPGRKPWTKRFEVLADGAKVSVKVEAPVIALEPSGPPSTAFLGARQWPIGIGVTAGGAAGLLIGGVMGALSLWKRDAANAGPCDSYNYCTGEGVSLRDEALQFGDVSTVAFIAGGVLAGAGVALLVLAPPSDAGPRSTTARVSVWPGGVAVAGGF